MVKSNVKNKKNENIVRKKGHRGAIIGIAILLIILAFVAYVVLTFGSLPLAIISSGQLNSQGIMQTTLQKINSTSSFNLTYNGSIIVNNTDPKIYLQIIKINGQNMDNLIITNFPALGTIQANFVQKGNQINWCESDNYSNKCGNTTINKNSYYFLPAIEYLANSIENSSTLSDLNISNYGLRLYHSQPCFDFSGTGAVDVNGAFFNQSGYIPSRFKFNVCVSAEQNVPLFINVTDTVVGTNKYMHINLITSGMKQ